MKKNVLAVLAIGLMLAQLTPVLAATVSQTASDSAKTTTSTITPTLSAEDKDVQKLKEKVANKVSELRKKEDQKAISGVVTDIKTTTAKIKTDDGTDYEVKIDETLTKVFQVTGLTKKDMKVTDIKKGSYLIVTGPLLDRTITANDIYEDEQFIVKAGKIIDINTTDNYVDVVTTDKVQYTVDIETKTQISLLNIKTLDQDKIGFSKLKENDTVHFVAHKGSSTTDNRFAGDKLLIIPQEYFQK